MEINTDSTTTIIHIYTHNSEIFLTTSNASLTHVMTAQRLFCKHPSTQVYYGVNDTGELVETTKVGDLKDLKNHGK